MTLSMHRPPWFILASLLCALPLACSGASDDAGARPGDDADLSSDSTTASDSNLSLDSDLALGDSNVLPDSAATEAPIASDSGSDTSSTSSDATTSDTGTTALVNPKPGSASFIGANFWNIDWEGSGDFFKGGVDFSTTTDPWRPELLADLAPYHVLRFMDWNLTNDSGNKQADWTTRKLKTQPQNEPVAFEWQIDLCNRTKKDYWLNIPHESSPEYWTKLATLVRDQLDPSLRVYLEWSNEVWNGGFPQQAYAAGKATSLGLPGSDHAAAYYVYVSVRAYEAFEAVFGKGNPRLVKVLAGQAGWTGPCEAQMTALSDPKINPKGTKPDVYAIAPYFGGTSISALRASLTEITNWTKNHVTCVKAAGLPLISYEGGQDSFAAGGAGCEALQTDPAMHDLYMTYLDDLKGAGLSGPFMQYTHTGSCWGLKKKTGDALSASPKYKGVIDWIAAHP